MYKILLLLMFSCSFSVVAQVNATSPLLLKSGKASQEDEFNSDWFTVKKEQKPISRKTQAVSTPTKAPAAVSAQSSTQDKKIVEKKVEEEKIHNESPSSNEQVVDQLRNIVLGGSEEDIHKIKERLHEQDPRKNMVFVNFAPTYLSNKSESSYWFRNHKSEGPGFYLGAYIWFTPFLGFQADYHTTLGLDVTANSTSDERLLADQQRITAGIRFRKLFGFSLKAPTLELGLDYYENNFLVPKDATQRIRVKSTGLQVGLKAVIPKSKSFAWLLESKLVPGLSVEEIATGIDVESGSNNTSNMLTFSLGGRFLLDRQQQVFWRLEHQIEKSLYEGSTSVNDPIEGSTLSGVNVTNTTSIFYLGYAWGH